MTRIDKRFNELISKNKKAFIPFITVGDPNIDVSFEIVKLFIESDVTLIELGHPFSDPLADGPVIQASSQRALNAGVNTDIILDFVKKVRSFDDNIPLVLMGYFNPIYQYGLERFAKACAEVGLDGTIIPDLPMEEAHEWINITKKYNLSNIMLITPTTPLNRAKKIIKISSGFVYYVSITGITGERETLPDELAKNLINIKTISDKPVCVGFGISKPEHVHIVKNLCDGVIVGSAIVRIIEKNLLSDLEGKKKIKDSCIPDLQEFIIKMMQALSNHH